MHLKKERTCIVCRSKKLQSDMTRIVRINNNVIVGEKKFGRGAYICNNISCIENLKKTKALNRAFKSNINIEEYDRIKEILVGKQQN